MYEVKCEECGLNNIVCKCREDRRSELIDLLNASGRLEHENAALERMLIEVCNCFMDVDNNGRLINSVYAEPVNKLLGI